MLEYTECNKSVWYNDYISMTNDKKIYGNIL